MAARVLQVYGEGSTRSKRLKETLKGILERTNLQEVYKNRKKLLGLESTNNRVSIEHPNRKILSDQVQELLLQESPNLKAWVAKRESQQNIVIQKQN